MVSTCRTGKRKLGTHKSSNRPRRRGSKVWFNRPMGRELDVSEAPEQRRVGPCLRGKRRPPRHATLRLVREGVDDRRGEGGTGLRVAGSLGQRLSSAKTRRQRQHSVFRRGATERERSRISVAGVEPGAALEVVDALKMHRTVAKEEPPLQCRAIVITRGAQAADEADPGFLERASSTGSKSFAISSSRSVGTPHGQLVIRARQQCASIHLLGVGRRRPRKEQRHGERERNSARADQRGRDSPASNCLQCSLDVRMPHRSVCHARPRHARRGTSPK